MNISEFFTSTLGANLANSRWSWGAFNPITNQLFLRVWDDEFKLFGDKERSLILKSDWSGASGGFPERIRHIDALRRGADGYGVVCTARDIHARSRTIAKFDRDFLIEFGDVVDDGMYVYATVRGRVAVDSLARPQTSTSSIVPDLKAIFSKSMDTTEKETLANARVGQGAFRAGVLNMWDSSCCVTGSQTLDAIRASHIKPWRDSDNAERLDPNNGLPLIATLDALFDAGLISFAESGTLMVSERLNAREQQVLRLKGLNLMKQPNERTSQYLAYHRDEVFIEA